MYSPNPVCANTPSVDLQVAPVFGTTGYTWTFPAGVTPILDLGNEQIVNWGPMGGTVTVTVSNTCGNSSKNQLIALGCREAGTQEETVTVSDVTVYPNPAHDKVNVQFNAEEKTDYVLNLLDLSGRVISTSHATAEKGINTSEMDLSRLAKGVYMAELKVTC